MQYFKQNSLVLKYKLSIRKESINLVKFSSMFTRAVKRIASKKNGYISIEIVVAAAIVLFLGSYLLKQLDETARGAWDSAKTRIEEAIDIEAIGD